MQPFEVQKNQTLPLITNFDEENAENVESLYRNDSAAKITNKPQISITE